MLKTDEIAFFLGIGSRRVQQLARMGVFPKIDKNQYELFACIRGYLKYLRRLAMRFCKCYRQHLQHNHNVRVQVENLPFLEDIESQDKIDACYEMFGDQAIKEMENNYEKLQQLISTERA